MQPMTLRDGDLPRTIRREAIASRFLAENELDHFGSIERVFAGAN